MGKGQTASGDGTGAVVNIAISARHSSEGDGDIKRRYEKRRREEKKGISTGNDKHQISENQGDGKQRDAGPGLGRIRVFPAREMNRK